MYFLKPFIASFHILHSRRQYLICFECYSRRECVHQYSAPEDVILVEEI